MKRQGHEQHSAWFFLFWDKINEQHLEMSFNDNCGMRRLTPGTYPERPFDTEKEAFLWTLDKMSIFIDQQVVTGFQWWFWDHYVKGGLVELRRELESLSSETAAEKEFYESLRVPFLIKEQEKVAQLEDFCFQQGKVLQSSLVSDASVFIPLRGDASRDAPRWKNFLEMYGRSENDGCSSCLTHVGISLPTEDRREWLDDERKFFGAVLPGMNEKKSWGERFKEIENIFMETNKYPLTFRCMRRIW